MQNLTLNSFSAMFNQVRFTNILKVIASGLPVVVADVGGKVAVASVCNTGL